MKGDDSPGATPLGPWVKRQLTDKNTDGRRGGYSVKTRRGKGGSAAGEKGKKQSQRRGRPILHKVLDRQGNNRNHNTGFGTKKKKGGSSRTILE